MKLPLEDKIRRFSKDEPVSGFFIKYCLLGFLLHWFVLIALGIFSKAIGNILSGITGYSVFAVYYLIYFPITYKLLQEKSNLLKKRYDAYYSCEYWLSGSDRFNLNNIKYYKVFLAKLTKYIYGFFMVATFLLVVCSILFKG